MGLLQGVWVPQTAEPGAAPLAHESRPCGADDRQPAAIRSSAPEGRPSAARGAAPGRLPSQRPIRSGFGAAPGFASRSAASIKAPSELPIHPLTLEKTQNEKPGTGNGKPGMKNRSEKIDSGRFSVSGFVFPVFHSRLSTVPTQGRPQGVRLRLACLRPAASY